MSAGFRSEFPKSIRPDLFFNLCPVIWGLKTVSPGDCLEQRSELFLHADNVTIIKDLCKLKPPGTY